MKSNFFKYIFIVFFIGIMIFAIYKIRTEEETKNQTQSQTVENEQEHVREINLGIAEYDTLNPIVSNNKNVQDIQKVMYEPLINLTTDYKVETCLAVECAKQNANTYILKLREGVKFADGTSFTATDVKFTMDLLKQGQSIYSYNVEGVENVEIVDDHTLTVTLANEIPFFEYNLTFPIVEAANYSNEAIPGGTGKFKILNLRRK